MIKSFNDSYLKKVFDFLFGDNFELALEKTVLGRFLLRFSLPYSTEIAVFSAVILLWYERLFDNYLPLLGADFLPPLLLGLGVLFSDKKKFIIKKYHLWYLGLLFVATLSGLFAVLRGVGPSVIFGWVVYLQFFLALLLGEFTKSAKRFMDFLLVSILPVIGYGFYQYFFIKKTGSTYSALETKGIRASSLFSNPNIYGYVLTIISLIIIMKVTKIKEKSTKLLLLISLVPVLFSLFLTGSRSAWLALFLGAGVLFLLERPRLVLLSPLGLLLLFVKRFRERVSVLFNPDYYYDSSIDGRLWAMKNGFFILKKYPVFGTGPGTYGGKFASQAPSPVYLEGMQRGYPAIYTTDNQFIENLVQLGLVGFGVFVGFLFSLGRFLWSRREQAFGILAFSIFISFSAMALTSNVLNFSVISIPCAIIFGAALGKGDKI